MQPTLQYMIDLAVNPEERERMSHDNAAPPRHLPSADRNVLAGRDHQTISNFLAGEVSATSRDAVLAGSMAMELGPDPSPDFEPLPDPEDVGDWEPNDDAGDNYQ